MKNQKEPAPASGRDQAGTKQGPSKDQVGTKQALSRHQAGTKLELGPEQANILAKCKKPITMAELMKTAARSNRTKFRKSIITPLLSAELLEMTEPDSPKSPTQKYRTTAKGRELLETIDFE